MFMHRQRWARTPDFAAMTNAVDWHHRWILLSTSDSAAVISSPIAERIDRLAPAMGGSQQDFMSARWAILPASTAGRVLAWSGSEDAAAMLGISLFRIGTCLFRHHVHWRRLNLRFSGIGRHLLESDKPL
jgi:hypothetical protein